MGTLRSTSTSTGGRLLLLALLFFVAGCASYTDRIKEAHRSVVQGQPERAIDLLNEELDVDDASELPARLNRNRALLLLERATLLQASGRYDLASRDMIHVDDRLEWVDLSAAGASDVLRYVYSDDAGLYRPPPHERLLLHAFNIINFLADGDFGAARVEARRFDILQNYFLEDEIRAALPGILGFGNYMAGAAFEASRDYDEAARFYTRAYLYGVWPEGNPNRLLDLLAMTDYRGTDLGKLLPDMDALLKQVAQRERPDRRTYQQRYQQGDMLIVVQTGLVPYRRAERIPLATALTYSSRSPYAGVYLSTQQRNQAMHLYRRGIVTWLNVPVLTRQGLPPRRVVNLDTGNRSLRLTQPISISDQVEEGWHIVGATAMAAAISRAVVRAVAGESTRVVSDQVAQHQGASPLAAGFLSWLISLAVEGSMAAADTPDTRSWTSLPADVHLVRTTLPPGPRTISVLVDGRSEQKTIDHRSDRFQLVNFSRYR